MAYGDRTVNARFWKDAKIRALPPACRMIALCIMTRDAADYVHGLTLCSVQDLMQETGHTKAEVSAGLRRMNAEGVLKHDLDAGVFWLVNAFRWKVPANRNVGVAWVRKLQFCPECLLVLTVARAMKLAFEEADNSECLADPIALLSGYLNKAETTLQRLVACTNDQGSRINDHRSQIIKVCPELAGPASGPDDEPVLIFPCQGKPKTWNLTARRLEDMRSLYPGLDVGREAKKAYQWIKDNPKRAKTASGYPKFFTAWCDRSANRGVNGSRNSGPKKPMMEIGESLADYEKRETAWREASA